MKALTRLMPLGSLAKVAFAFPAVTACQGASYRLPQRSDGSDKLPRLYLQAPFIRMSYSGNL